MAVPVPSIALRTKKMQFGLGAVLAVLGAFLVTGLVAMAGAAVREAKLEPGKEAGVADKRRGRIAAVVGAVIVIAVVWAGNSWWNSEAGSYGTNVYKPLQMEATVSGQLLTLKMIEPGWMQPVPGALRRRLFVRKMDDLVPDHGHLMHLYAIRQPGMDVVYHLHPELVEGGLFRLELPSMPTGNYKLYADIVHADGFPETMVSSLELPGITGRPLRGDDATGTAQAWQHSATTATEFTLQDGYRMTWLRSDAIPRARQATAFHFRLTKPDGSAPNDMELYMGMLGHAAFVKTDGTVFAHVHPNGSVSMAALTMAEQQAGVTESSGMPSMEMRGMGMPGSLPDEVMFPYGFPSAGRYRIFVQMKHGQTVETGIFDAQVAGT